VQRHINFSTAQAAQYWGVKPHVLLANNRRNGSFRGVVPLKGRAGRLHWPADEVRESSLPSCWEQPDGGPLLLDVLRRVCPGIEVKDGYRLVLFLLGSEALRDWRPVPGQTAATIKAEELKLALMILQATLDRFDWALGPGKESAVDVAIARFSLVLSGRLSSLAGGLSLGAAAVFA